MSIRRRSLIGTLVTGFFILFFAVSTHAQIIQRTITVDGAFADWDGTGPPAGPGAPDIITNAGQFSFDEVETSQPSPGVCGDLDATFKATPSPGSCGLQSTGRDLRYFAYTYDPNRLYMYVERYASSTNITDWYFYLDVDGNDVLTGTERVLHVAWRGSNRKTTITLHNYAPANPAGDPILGGDGFTMPGSLGVVQTYSLPANPTGGGPNGLRMETQVLWSEVCSTCSGAQPIKFHISSGNNTNLPSGIIDNMDGPAGGIITWDIAVDKTASVTEASLGDNFSYTITATASGNATTVSVDDTLPSEVSYTPGNYTATKGTYDGTTWAIGSMADGDIETLTINVTGGVVASTTVVTNTATLSLPDTNASNNVGEADVTFTPPMPNLSITKTRNTSTVSPLGVVTYTVTVQNLGNASGVILNMDDDLSPYVAIDIDFDNNAGNGLDPFDFDANDSTLARNATTYDDGTNNYTHSLTDSGGLLSGFDADVTDWRMTFSGSMPPGTSFTLTYDVKVE